MVIYIFYADVFFLSNVLMNSCILLIAGEINHTCKKYKILRIAAAALVGGGMELVFILLLKNEILYLAASHFVAIPIMVFVAFGRCRINTFLKNAIACYGAALLLGGAVEAIENTWGIHRMPLLAGAAAMLVCIPLFRYLVRAGKMGKSLFAVELMHRGKTVRCTGLLDTGNLLMEPVKNMPVSILSPELMKKLAVEDEDRCGILLYQSLGTSQGALETYCIDRLAIKNDGTWQYVSPAIVAAAPKELLCGKNYEVILNAQVMLHGL
jgi:stage II sporulation protein GA (sporulation sigma-E factor processing peptidase)